MLEEIDRLEALKMQLNLDLEKAVHRRQYILAKNLKNDITNINERLNKIHLNLRRNRKEICTALLEEKKEKFLKDFANSLDEEIRGLYDEYSIEYTRLIQKQQDEVNNLSLLFSSKLSGGKKAFSTPTQNLLLAENKLVKLELFDEADSVKRKLDQKIKDENKAYCFSLRSSYDNQLNNMKQRHIVDMDKLNRKYRNRVKALVAKKGDNEKRLENRIRVLSSQNKLVI